MGLRTHHCKVLMFVIMLTEVLFPILTDWGLSVRKFRSQSQILGCRPSVVVGEFVGDDCVEDGAVVHTEHTDAGVFIFQVGEGIVENRSDNI